MKATMRRLYCACSSFCTLSLMATANAGTPIDVYILSGQSNMVGSGVVETLDPSLAIQENVLYHYSITLDPANQDPVGAPEVLATAWGPLRELSEEGHSFGLELAFGRAIADASDNQIAIIKTAINGAAIRYYTPAFGYWQYLGPYAQSAIEDLEAQGYEPTVKAFVWVQGSSDANHTEHHAMYAEHLRTLTESVRDLWGSDLHVAQSQQFCCSPFTQEQIQAVRVAKSQFTAADANATLTPVDDIRVRADMIHFESSGLLELGERLAADLLGHVPEDINADGIVDTADLGALISSFHRTERSRADLNGDRAVDVADLGILLAEFGGQ